MKPLLLAVGLALAPCVLTGGTVALWLFDEPAGSYPSTILNDSAGGYIVALGRAGRIAEGRFGRALEVTDPRPLEIRYDPGLDLDGAAAILFGLRPRPTEPGRKTAPLWWGNAIYSALGTVGEGHLRKANFRNPTEGPLNLGPGDWTVEFWLQADSRPAEEEQTVLEIGSGPRGENELWTRLVLLAKNQGMAVFRGREAAAMLVLRNRQGFSRTGWTHWALSHEARTGKFRLFVDGRLEASTDAPPFPPLPRGEEAILRSAATGFSAAG